MNAEILAGLFGLGGTLVGAGVSGWATVRSLRHQSETAQRQQEEARAKLVEERGRAAGEKALSELYALRRHVAQPAAGPTEDDRDRWVRIGQEHCDEAELAAGLMPQAEELRTRLQDALTVVWLSVLGDRDRTRNPYEAESSTAHAINLLSAYMRGDPLPPPSGGEDHRRIEREMYELENPPHA